ncbi:MAG: hypothetical protein ACI91F_003490, partial [Candidatus Binatia bacterium]
RWVVSSESRSARNIDAPARAPWVRPRSVSRTLGALLALAVIAGSASPAASQDESVALKNCLVDTKVMAGEFSRLGDYMKSPDAEDSFARQILVGANSALQRAQASCAQFPEMDGVFEPLAEEVGRIDRGLSK